MAPIRISDREWQIAKAKIHENLKNAEIAQQLGIKYDNNVSRTYQRFIKKIEQFEKDLVRAIELGLYEPKIINRFIDHDEDKVEIYQHESQKQKQTNQYLNKTYD